MHNIKDIRNDFENFKIKVEKRNISIDLDEIIQLGINSLFIVSIMSAFMGAVLVIQTATAIESAWIPDYTVGFTVKQSMLLEFCPTIISLILAGKVGSNIASELGTMKLSEQVDALEVMGVNSVGFLIGPKIIGSLLIFIYT